MGERKRRLEGLTLMWISRVLRLLNGWIDDAPTILINLSSGFPSEKIWKEPVARLSWSDNLLSKFRFIEDLFGWRIYDLTSILISNLWPTFLAIYGQVISIKEYFINNSFEGIFSFKISSQRSFTYNKKWGRHHLVV